MEGAGRMSQPPGRYEEYALRAQGYPHVCGMDEAGRGALAGPVVAAAVILPYSEHLPWMDKVRDSKELSPTRREVLASLIRREALAVGVGIVAPQVIDTVNILRATRLAMKQALGKLPHQPDFLLIDGLTLPLCPVPQRGVIHGDRLCLCIACASIIAKVTRDHIMEQLDVRYPGYGLARHKGYGTREHMRRLQQREGSPIHRFSFAPLRKASA